MESIVDSASRRTIIEKMRFMEKASAVTACFLLIVIPRPLLAERTAI